MFCTNLIIFFTLSLIITLIFMLQSINTVFSLLLLILSFIISSFIMLLLDCEYLAFMFLIIYISAITVLFLFAFMLLDIKFKSVFKKLIIDFLIGYVFIFCIFLLIFFVKFDKLTFFSKYCTVLKPINFINWKYLLNSNNKINVYSKILYNNFILEFLIIGLILFLVLIGIVYLINNYLSLNLKLANSIKQVSLKSKFFY